MITIIVPTFNQANFLPAALDSLLAQTYSNWETVVVNDGSTDNTAQVANEYAARDQRIRVIHQPNGGVASALNTALRHARGEWICWLSSDDLFEPDKLAIHATYAGENPAVRFMYTSFSLLYDETGVKDINALNTSVIPSQELQVLQLFRFNYVNGISVAVHRDVFERVGGFSASLKNGQDYDMWLRISAHYPLHFINKRTSITRVHPSQGTAICVEAGIYDSCQSGLNFLNQHRFAALFPFLDLLLPKHAQFAVQHTVSVLTEPTTYINRCGFAQAMLDRLHEWLSESPVEICNMLNPYIAEVVRLVAQSDLPEWLRTAFCSLVPYASPFRYQHYDFFELLRHHVQNIEYSNHNEARSMKMYLSNYAQNIEQASLADKPMTVNMNITQEKLFFKESASAHKYCVGKGLEIGGSAHNPFGLNTLNVDFSDSMETIYKQEEVRACGKAMPVDIVAFGDNIPLPDESQDFIVSSHVLEHFPNPIKALKEWYRLVKPGGIIYMIVPHKERTFDSVQPRTTLEHLVQDYHNDETRYHENPQGHDHCWITEDILEVIKWMTGNLDLHWTLLEIQDVDDKVGNGFTFVLKKDDALPIPFGGKPESSESEPRSVLFVVHGFPPTAVGGVEVYTRNLAKEMTSRGVRVTVLYPVTDSSGTAYAITSDVVEGLTLVKLHVPKGNLFTSIISQDIESAFGNFLKTHSFDVIHFHHIFEHLSISMITTAKETGIPVALTLHDFWFICPRAQLFIEENGTVCSGPESPAKCARCVCRAGWCTGGNEAAVEEVFVFRQAYVRKLLLEVDLLFSPSRFVADIFDRYAFGDNRITVAPLGIGKFAVNRYSSDDCLRFGFMGTIHPVKNILLLVKAFTATYGNARLEIFGGGEAHRISELKNCISDVRITYHGSYTSEQLPEILSNIDVLVVPSLIESYCLTAREALSSGIPVLAARVGGLLEAISDGVNGVFFDPLNNRELTCLLQQFINDRKLLKTLNGGAIPVKTIADDAQFLLGQYACRTNRSVGQKPVTAVVTVEQVSRLSYDNPASKMTDKIVIAVYSLDHYEQACGHYRIYAPFKVLSESIEVLQGIIIQDNEYIIKLEAAISADVIVVQRFIPSSKTAELLDWLYSLGKPVVFEIDDLLTKIPLSNPSYACGMESAPHIYNFIKKCAAVTVSTEELKRQFIEYNDAIQILPNMLDEVLWSKPSPKSSGPIVIGYAGTITHATDLELVEGVLERIAQQYGNRVSFTFMGCATERLARLPGFDYIKFEVDYEGYARRLQEIPVDIMLIPLEDNEFNRCKSNIKWLEYSACGYAGIYADLPPYNTSVEHGKTGLLVGNNPQQWYEAISLLIENKDLRRFIAFNARAEVLTCYSLAANAYKWLDTYQTIIRNHTALQVAGKDTQGEHASKPVSIIIPLFNNLEFTRRCLETLTAGTPQHLYELVLIDNGSTDGTHGFLSSLPTFVKVIRNPNNQGFAKACNQGALAANGKYLLFLNNDTEPQPGWLEALLSIADQDPAVAAVGSKLLFPDGTIQHAGVVIADDWVAPDPLVGKHIYCGLPADHPEANISRNYQAMTAACLLVRRDAFEAVQGFDEGYWNGYEDVDLCFKLGQKGWKIVYQPASVVVHHESKSGSERFAKAAQNIKRLHDKWLEIIQPDVILHPGSRVEWLGRGAAAMIAPPLVSIIIPLFNQAQLTNACIEAIRATAGDPGRYELILVDNGSRDWTPEYLYSLGDSVVVITNKENQGFAKACNQAVRIAKGEYLLFLNNDTVPQPGWLDALLSGIREEGGDIVGAKLLYPNGRVQHAGTAFNRIGMVYHIFRDFSGDAPAANRKRFMQCVTAACMLVSRQLFSELGGFDEQYRNGFEDVDFCLRAGQAGKRVLYNPQAVVIHHESQSEGRKQHDPENIRLYFERWQGKVRCDDEELHAAEGFSVEWRADGSYVVRPLTTKDTDRENCRYPLIPLVAHSSSSLLQKLSSSQRVKGVLMRYTTETDI